MLPTIKEQDKKLKVLVDKYPEDKDMCYEDIFKFAKQYAKWYAIEIIKHCSEVAELDYECHCDCGNCSQVDKQSILNVINEL